MIIKNFWQKNNKKIIPILALAVLALSGHFIFQRSEAPKEPSAFREKALGSLQEQVGQMLLLGFRGTKFQEKSFVDKAINELKIGGVVLFDYDAPSGIFPRNITSPEQTKQLVDSLQKHSQTPLLIAIDVEGGYVNRLKEKYGFIDIPSAQKMGQGTAEQTLQVARNLGKQLSDLGVNFDFAPVVDLNTNPQNPVIGKIERSFSSDPLIVITQAESFIKGLSEYSIITSLKHFPGHGSSQTDSHKGIADITSTYQAQELVPFQELIKKGLAPTVMVAHTFNKNLDAEYPASLSKNTIQKTLKDLVGFNGVVVCDDLSMGAISKNYGLTEAVVKMVEAGCDLIIISNNVSSYDETLPYKVQSAILQAVKNGTIATSSIETSYNKIINLKKSFNITK